MSRKAALTIDNRVRITGDVPDHILSKIMNRLTFENPQYIDAKNRGFSTWNIPRHIHGYEKEGKALILPRGSIQQVLGIIKDAGLPYHIEDHRRSLQPVHLQFMGSLRDFQKEAVDKMLDRDSGTLSAPTGSGKTVMALAIIAERKQPALIVVHNKELVNQWIERIEAFMGIPRADVGIIGAGKKTFGTKITVGIINSIYKVSAEIRHHFGHIVVDECHRAPSRTFTEGLKSFDARYLLGLSATPWRRDKLSRLIYWNVGDIVHKIEQGSLMDSGDVLRAEVITRETNFSSDFDPSEQYSLMLSDLTKDRGRNTLIVKDVAQEVREGSGVCLVLTDRKAHVDELTGMLNEKGIHASMLTGDLSDGERRRVVEDLKAGKVGVLVATGQLIGEGFDCKDLSTLFLACPIRFNGRLLQYLGRVLRPAQGKEKGRIYDYIDSRVGVLVNAARARQKVYESTS